MKSLGRPRKAFEVSASGRVALLACGFLLWLCAADAAPPGSAAATSPEMAATYQQYGASQAVRVGDTLYIGGIVAMDASGATIAPDDGRRQAEVIYTTIRQLLKAHGADARHVVSERLYISNYEQYWLGAPVRQQFYDEAGADYPATVGFQVAALSSPDFVFEVQLTADLRALAD